MRTGFCGNESLICVGVTFHCKICMDVSLGVITSILYFFLCFIVYTSSSGKSSDRLMLCICKTPSRGADAVAHKSRPLKRLMRVKVKQILCLSTYYHSLQGLILFSITYRLFSKHTEIYFEIKMGLGWGVLIFSLLQNKSASGEEWGLMAGFYAVTIAGFEPFLSGFWWFCALTHC